MRVKGVEMFQVDIPTAEVQSKLLLKYSEFQNTGGQCLLGIIQGIDQVQAKAVCFHIWRSTATDIHEAVHIINISEITRSRANIHN